VAAALGLILANPGNRIGGAWRARRSNANNAAMDLARPKSFSNSNGSTVGIRIEDILSDDDTLRYEGYTLRKRRRKAKIDYPPEATSRPTIIDVSFASLTRGGRLVFNFDADVYFGMGNNTRFGLFPLLGSSSHQLIVSQDVPRRGAQWIARLSPDFQIIFDGKKWQVGREGDDMEIVDLDHDGVYEIALPITDFYLFQDKMSMSEIPLPTIVFEYDERSHHYLPANKLFPNYALPDGAANLLRVDPANETLVRSRVLRVLLDDVYAGQALHGWAVFEREYNLSDKEEMRRRVKSILKSEPVFKFIYRR
jgi:hypothetical protein